MAISSCRMETPSAPAQQRAPPRSLLLIARLQSLHCRFRERAAAGAERRRAVPLHCLVRRSDLEQSGNCLRRPDNIGAVNSRANFIASSQPVYVHCVVSVAMRVVASDDL